MTHIGKSIAGALLEFDLRSCENIPTTTLCVSGLTVRRGMHTSFLTGVAMGLVYSKELLERCGIDSDSFDFEAFKRDMNDYFEQVIKRQSEIEL